MWMCMCMCMCVIIILFGAVACLRVLSIYDGKHAVYWCLICCILRLLRISCVVSCVCACAVSLHRPWNPSHCLIVPLGSIGLPGQRPSSILKFSLCFAPHVQLPLWSEEPGTMDAADPPATTVLPLFAQAPPGAQMESVSEPWNQRTTAWNVFESREIYQK